MPKKAEPARGKAKAKPAKAARKSTTKKAAAAKQAGKKGCNTPSRAEVFVAEYLVDLNGRQAAIRAGYSPDSARQRAAELLATAPVQLALEEAMAARAERTGITADRVLERWWAVATANPRELTELWHCCCRYCWGTNNLYQRTPREMAEAKAAHDDAAAKDAKEPGTKAKLKPFAMLGGIGWNPHKDPNPACPECFGNGVEVVVAKDTRDLSPSASLLYAGVKTTQNGLEIKMHSQGDALANVAKHLGMLATRLKVGNTDNPDDDEDATGFVLIPAKKLRNHDPAE